jgi:hypothetical protein
LALAAGFDSSEKLKTLQHPVCRHRSGHFNRNPTRDPVPLNISLRLLKLNMRIKVGISRRKKFHPSLSGFRNKTI